MLEDEKNESDAPPEGDLRTTTTRNVAWSMFSLFGSRVLTLAGTAVLARHLEPSDFGVVGLVGIVTGLVTLIGNFGLGAAIIYRKDVDEGHLATSYWFNVAVGIVLTVITIAFAGTAAGYFHNETVRPVAYWLSLNFLINSLSWAHGCMLTKNLRFRALAIIRVSSVVIRGITAILLAVVFDFGLWALVAADLAMNTFASFGRLAAYRWRPPLTFSVVKFRQLFRYGINLTGSSILGYFASNIDYILIGRLLDSTQLGFYQFSYSVPHMVQHGFTMSLTRVLFPVFCKVQDDNARFGRGYVRTLRVITLLAFPALIGLAVIGAPFVRVVYGARWEPVILPMQILCFSAIARSMMAANGPVLNAKGRPDVGFYWSGAHLVLTAATVWFLARYGVIGIAAGMTLSAYYSAIPAYIATRMIRLPFRRWIAAAGPAALCTVIMSALVFSIRRWMLLPAGASDPAQLLILAPLGAGVYALLFRFLFPADWRDLFELARSSFLSGRRKESR
ncbi:MAG: MOP flippase family protein [Candidatus Eisenbacteria bacterium]|nr:MOP flippase family protein [Candidatus Eisenbacteria bacterium]